MKSAVIPQELRDLDQWVVWQFEEVPGDPPRITKVLYEPGTKRKARSNDPGTWTSFDHAYSEFQIEKWDGIGFVLTANDPYLAIDFDKCIDLETGAILPHIRGYIETFDSYSEKSPSGTGVHVFLKAGGMPGGGGGRKTATAEAYFELRFMTMTGDLLAGSSTEIRPNQEAIDTLWPILFPPKPTAPRSSSSISVDLSDDEVLDKLRNAANSSKFLPLFAGDTRAYGGDHSAADLALLGIMKFYTDDRAQLDRLYRRSALMRDKWDERHSANGDSYGTMTINTALSSMGDHYSAPRPVSARTEQETLKPPAPPAYPSIRPEAFHGLVGEIVEASKAHNEGDPIGIAVNVILRFASSAGRHPHVMVGDGRHGVNENAVLVGLTAKGRKGETSNPVDRIMKVADNEWVISRNVSGASSGEGLIWAVRDEITKEEPTKDADGKVTGTRTVVLDAGVKDKRLFVLEEEFSSVLKQTERDGNTLSEIIRRFWDGRYTVQALTKNSQAKSTGGHVTFLAHITIDEVKKRLNETEMANGMANRFMWFLVKRVRLISMPKPMPDDVVEKLARKMTKALEHARTVGQLTFSVDALKRWSEIYEQLSSSRPGLLGALTARSEAHTLRLAMIYALLDCSKQIETHHLDAALALWDYSAASVLHIFGDATGNSIADRILSSLRSEGDLSKEEISSLFARNVPAGRLDGALRLLEQLQLATSYADPEYTGGRKKTFWKALYNTSFISYVSTEGKPDSVPDPPPEPGVHTNEVNELHEVTPESPSSTTEVIPVSEIDALAEELAIAGWDEIEDIRGHLDELSSADKRATQQAIARAERLLRQVAA